MLGGREKGRGKDVKIHVCCFVSCSHKLKSKNVGKVLGGRNRVTM